MKIYQVDYSHPSVQLALAIIAAIADAGQTKELPDTDNHTPLELKAFDRGFTGAVLVLRSMGYPNLAAELVEEGEKLGVTLDESAIESYFLAGLP